MSQIGHNNEPTGTSRLSKEHKNSIRAALTDLAEARGESISSETFRVYLDGLMKHDPRDVISAITALRDEPKGEFEKNFPILGTVIERTVVACKERAKSGKRNCDKCNNARMCWERQDEPGYEPMEDWNRRMVRCNKCTRPCQN